MVLNNNYHAVHHDLPGVPWYALRHVYRARRSDYLERNGGYIVRGYLEWLREHALSPVAQVMHPLMDAPAKRSLDVKTTRSAAAARANTIRV